MTAAPRGPVRPAHAARAPRAVGYAYPWDYLGDPKAALRARALGIDAVAVAAAYHSVRAASPLHPARRLVEAPYAACYVPVRDGAWRGRRLIPRGPAWCASPDPFGQARQALRAQDLDVYAWVVLTHNSRLGRAHPELTVCNAFREHYPYALCPAAEEVIEYCGTLVREVVSVGRPDGLVLEACGPLGVVHGGHHDKTGLAGWTAAQEHLLSLCFCAACVRRYRGAGLDPSRIAAVVRGALAPGRTVSRAEDELGPQVAAALADVRAHTARDLRSHVVEQARAADPGLRLVLHASAGPWASGPFATVATGVGTDVDALVGSCWEPGPAGASALRALREVADPRTAIGGYLLADGTWLADGVRDRLRDYLDAGLDELHLYHLGLVGEAGLRLLADILAAAGRTVPAFPPGPAT